METTHPETMSGLKSGVIMCHRKFKGDEFKLFLTNALGQEKEMEYWKAAIAEHVKEVAYP